MHTAICAFDDKARAEQAVDSLVRSGFARHDVHIEHKHLHGEGGQTGTDRWDGMEREVAVDRHRLSAFGHFFARLLGRDASDHIGTYAQHVERGNYVVVVDSDDPVQAERARTMLHGMQPGDLTIVDRRDQTPLRDVVGLRGDGSGNAGMVERSRDTYEGSMGATSLQPDRAMASPNAVSPTAGPDLRDPDMERAPGLRYSDKDKPL
jgi:hypothetical protein